MKQFSFFGFGGWTVLVWLLLLGGCPAVQAQAPTWQAVTALSGTQSYVTATTSGNDGTLYLTGHFTGTALFGTTTLTSTGVGSDVFVAKWDCLANRFVWAVQAGGNTADIATAITVAGSTLYVTGWFSSTTASFGSATVTNSNAAATDFFLAKLTDLGASAAFGWARQLGSSGYEYGTAVVANGPALYVAGSFNSPALTVGPTTLLNVAPASPPIANGFVCKFLDNGSTGDIVWAQRCGGRSTPTALAAAGATLYVTGSFSGTGSFGLLAPTAVSNADIFVAKLQDQGTTSSYSWVQQPGTPSSGQATALALRETDVYVAGQFYGTAQFGPASLTSAGATDVFVAQLTDAGPSATFTGAVRAGGPDIDEAYAVLTAGTQDVYVGGGSGSAALSLGPFTLTHATNNYFSRDGFVTQLAGGGSSLHFTWAKALGGEGNDQVAALALNGFNLLVTGYISPAAAFDTFVVPATAGRQIGFLATLVPATLAASTAALGRPALTLAPNPARGTTTLSLPTLPRTPLLVLDALGRLVRTGPLQTSSATLDLTGLAPGMYTVRVDGQVARLLVE